MNTYNYNPYSDYTTYNALNRQTIVPNQSNLPGITTNNQDEYASYAEQILKMNIGKKVKVYVSLAGAIELRDLIFEGTIEAVGRDFLLIKSKDNLSFMLWSIYIDFIEFNEPIIF